MEQGDSSSRIGTVLRIEATFACPALVRREVLEFGK